MIILDWIKADDGERRDALQRTDTGKVSDVSAIIKEIFETVELGGDESLLNFTKKFDGVDLKSPCFDLSAMDISEISEDAKTAIKQAAANIEKFHKSQLPTSLRVETMSGVICEKVWRPIERVGLYIPGGSAPLISTLLMVAIPAKIAGVKEIVLATPPQNESELINETILWTAKWLGFEKIYTVGGAQAIAAMAIGTESIPKVDKIFGPGNIWVNEAKRYAASVPQGPSIDMPAGPSEVMVVMDSLANPSVVASDLLAQAEHDPLAHAVLVAEKIEDIKAVQQAVSEQLESLQRKDIATAAMEQAAYIIAADEGDQLEIINRYAPEHLILNTENARAMASKVSHAGSIFLGRYTPEAAGDYASGTNHVLPTAGAARQYSGLGTTTFMKSITVQEITKDGLEALGPTIETLAKLEGLGAHARSVSVRRTLKEQGNAI